MIILGRKASQWNGSQMLFPGNKQIHSDKGKQSRLCLCLYSTGTLFVEAMELSSKLLRSYSGSDSNLQWTAIGQISPREVKALDECDNPQKPSRLQGEASKTCHRCKMLPVPTDK